MTEQTWPKGWAKGAGVSHNVLDHTRASAVDAHVGPPRLFVQDSDFTLYVGDVRDCLRELPDRSVHTVVTSPPYWGLRDYGTGLWDGGETDCDHAQTVARHDGGRSGVDGFNGSRAADSDKGTIQFRDVCGKCGATRVDQQLGLEPTPEAFVAAMVDVFREVRRVLRDDGTLWLNLGDSYAGGKGQGGQGDAEYQAARASESLNKPHHQIAGPGRTRALDDRAMLREAGLKPKDMCGIPWKVAFALQADGWYLRSDIVWSKPNPMPESVTDRPTKAHEYVFLLSKGPRYFFDADAIREPHTRPDLQGKSFGSGQVGTAKGMEHGGWGNLTERVYNPTGRNVRSVWEMNQTGRSKGTRYTLHEDYFADIATEEQAYWLGFLYADGHLGSRHVDVMLAEKDAGHLERLRIALGSSRPITMSRDDTCARVMASSRRMADDLRRHGMATAETLPELDPELVRHFVRGVFDGDGSAWKYLPAGRTRWRYGAQFLGHEPLLTQVREILELRGKPKLRRGIHVLSIAAADDIARLYAYLYDGATVYLERKRAAFPQAQHVAPDVWPIATQPYPDAHFATFPEALPERCIKAGSSERGCCPECGAPWVRRVVRAGSTRNGPTASGWREAGERASQDAVARVGEVGVETVGWRVSCDCHKARGDFDRFRREPKAPVPCTVLDPFMGSGTTALVARRLGRKSIGVELNPEYAELCARRLQQLSLLA